jgi:hypothetical protein
MAEYREKFIANIRILGFEELLGRSAAPTPAITPDEIIDALEVPKLGESTPQITGRIEDISEIGHRMTAFANWLAITVDPTVPGLVHLLRHVAMIGFRLLQLTPPVLCRGGITRGLVYHTGQIVLGPGLGAAYVLAEQVSRYPRVILSQEVSRFVLAASPPAAAIIKGFVRQDETDGLYFVNILRVLRLSMEFEKEPLSHIRAISEHIDNYLKQEIARHSGEGREEFRWFKRYFDWATGKSGAEDEKRE